MTTQFLGEGETTPVTSTLYNVTNGTRAVADLSGLTLAIAITDRTGASVPVSGKASIVTAASGTVKYEPADTDFKAAGSPYNATWLVTDGNGDTAWYPMDDSRKGEQWIVRKL